jgi:translation initiation factor 4G
MPTTDGHALQADTTIQKELEYKVTRQLNRIKKPEHSNEEIDWGDLRQIMTTQTPSENLKYIHFNTGDVFTFFGICKGFPHKEFDITLSYDLDPAVVKNRQHLRLSCNPAKDLMKKGVLTKFQMLCEVYNPDPSSVRQKKVADKMLKNGIASAWTSFYAEERLIFKSRLTKLSMVTISGGMPMEKVQKKLIRYTIQQLLRFRPLYTEKPAGVDLQEIEKGVEMFGTLRPFKSFALHKAPISTWSRAPATSVRTKKLQVKTQWDKTQLDEFYRSINSLLNKMSKENFDLLKDKFLAMKGQVESDKSTLEVVVKLLYEKAINSPRFAPLYADLCSVLAKELNKVEMDDGKTVDFKSCILDHCKANLQKCFIREPIKAEMSEEEKAEKEFKRKERMKSNITFIGELFLRHLLRPVIVHLVIRSLLEEDENGILGRPDPEQLDLCLKLLKTIEGFKGYPKEQATTGRYYDHLARLAEEGHYDMRITFAIEDLLKLRETDFVSKAPDGKTPQKTTDTKTSKKTEGRHTQKAEAKHPQRSDARHSQKNGARHNQWPSDSSNLEREDGRHPQRPSDMWHPDRSDMRHHPQRPFDSRNPERGQKVADVRHTERGDARHPQRPADMWHPDRSDMMNPQPTDSRNPERSDIRQPQKMTDVRHLQRRKEEKPHRGHG